MQPLEALEKALAVLESIMGPDGFVFAGAVTGRGSRNIRAWREATATPLQLQEVMSGRHGI
jgi:hypothetical protein